MALVQIRPRTGARHARVWPSLCARVVRELAQRYSGVTHRPFLVFFFNCCCAHPPPAHTRPCALVQRATRGARSPSVGLRPPLGSHRPPLRNDPPELTPRSLGPGVAHGKVESAAPEPAGAASNALLEVRAAASARCELRAGCASSESGGAVQHVAKAKAAAALSSAGRGGARDHLGGSHCHS